ncbi:MAG: WhiB family transcriptional regulator, redox-sensing transcriptional regulator [Patescibacteria group bacterium]|nr:WhiB family transcriptional regulator, redox-sensing transcriptional regulator [Patescibacteria group bacterium]
MSIDNEASGSQPVNWRRDADCQYVEDPEIFAGRTPEEAEAAKIICGTCAVRQECLDYALDNPESAKGWIYGGMTERERTQYRAWGTLPE